MDLRITIKMNRQGAKNAKKEQERKRQGKQQVLEIW
jgi:hypothetical protein